VIFTREDWEMVDGFYFPRKIGYYVDNDNQLVPTDWDAPNTPNALSVEFASLKVVTV